MAKCDSNCRCPEIGNVCKGTTPQGSTLEEMVKDYQKKYHKPLTDRLASLVTITDFICGQANKLEASEVEHLPKFKFCKNSHQFRMPDTTVKDANRILSGLQLDKMRTFKEVHEAVVEKIPAIEDFGILAAYDFTLRYCFSRDIYPENVFLHAGTKIGTKYLQDAGYDIKIIKGFNGVEEAELSSYPEPIASLGALYAEDFLCIYDKQLAKLKPVKK